MTGAVGAASARRDEPGPDSAALAPGPHGGDGAAVARQLGLDPAAMLDLSASLNPLAPDVAALVRRLDDTAVGTYPDAGPATQALAEAIGVAADRLLLTNGGAEAIALVAAEHPVGTVPEPAFSLYRRHLVEADAADHDQRALVWSANPTSPWGEIAPPDQAADVWDEAFWPLATGSWTRGDAGAYRIGSLTKLWACPGLRLGFVIAPTPDQRDAARGPPTPLVGERPGRRGPSRAPGGHRSGALAAGNRRPPFGPGRAVAGVRLRGPRVERQLGAGRGRRPSPPADGARRGAGQGLLQLRAARHDPGRRSRPTWHRGRRTSARHGASRPPPQG